MIEKTEAVKKVNLPNIPENKAKLALIDGRASKLIQAGLEQFGIEVIRTERYEGLYEAISYHPDIMFHHLGGEQILYAPGTNTNTLECLKMHGFKLICGATALKSCYPYNIAYNVARVGSLAFHNFSYTDPVLKSELQKRDVEQINVKQGYAKCSISVINEKSIITSDPSIAKAAEKKEVEALLIEPETGIILNGLNYGFIGGSSGLLNKNIWALTGNIQKLNANIAITKFLAEKGINIICLTNDSVIDIGSIVILSEES